jgi:hypothetical protein
MVMSNMRMLETALHWKIFCFWLNRLVCCHSEMHLNVFLQLQTALLKFPGVLMPLVDKCGIAVDTAVQKCDYFNTSEKFRYAAKSVFKFA